MELNKEAKKDILNGFIDILTRISSREFQKRVWIRGEGPECDSFDDVVCEFFGEDEAILAKYKDFGITDFQYQLLVKFRDAFRAFTDKNNYPEKFIDTPEWTRITEMAKEVLKAFNYQKTR
ncbi:MAG: hypothetical protein HKM07_06745 [Chlamydiae bacterium]|nr:hypothetical protein [Chlamydiota bacterium]